jgi:predicted PilT family ATPase
MIDVVIEGDALAAEMARREIEAIVNERTSTVNMRLKDIPAEFYPFLAGPHNGRVSDLEGGRDIKIQIPHYHTWKDQAPPQSAGQGQPVPFLAQPSLPIQISGDRIAAQQARSEIEALVAGMRRNLTLDQTPIDRGRHQFIIGDRGVSLHDFLAETGCALIKPPPGADDDNLYIVGPADKLQGGVDKVMELAEQMQSMNVDVAKPHLSARGGGHPHARNMTRYFQQKQALAELEKLHDASIVLPTGSDGPTAWEVYAKNFKNATKARQDIMNLVGAHPPSRFQPMQIDPFFHQHLQQREAPKIRREHGVHIVFPDGHGETPDILLVFEAPGSPSEYVIPRQQPSAAELKQHLQAIQQAQSYLQNIIAQQQALESRDIEAHPRYNEKIRRYLEREQQGLPQGQFPIQATFPTGRSKDAPGFAIRGPSSAVDDMNTKLLAFLEQEAKDEAERGFTTSFDYPQKFANFLIGKRGENINRLREEFDVEIQVKDGKCELKGPEKKCAACRAHILSQLKKFEDETTHTLKVKPQYHRELIGPKGAQVNRLQDRYNVRVNFPRNAAPTEDDATEGSVKNFRNQAPDEVIIKGPKKGADEAREELLNLLQWTMDNSHSASVSVQQSQVPSLIGAGGREMESLRLATGAQVDIPNARDAADASGRVEIKLKGTKKQVEDAKKLLQERAKVFDETVTKNIDVDRKHHKTLIGTGGANVRKLVTDAGGPDDNRAIAQIVRFPKQGDADNNIRIQGSKAMVDKIVAAIQAQVEEKAGQVSDSMDVPTEKHRILIGRGGEARRQLESKFNISIDIPRQGTSGPAASQIKLTGQPSDLEAAKEHIAGLIKEQEGETVDVPRKFHHDISDNGQIFRSLLRNHKVTVDHAGQQPPPRPTTRTPRGRANGGTAMPLITDDASSADTHSWELVDDSSVYEGADGDETIPWILRGSPEGVAKAKAQLEKALAEAGEPSWSGYLILSDPKTYRHIIGPGGSQINSIRKKTGTKVQVPKNQGEGEAVEIVGTKEGVEEAKQIILDIVKNAGNGGPRR